MMRARRSGTPTKVFLILFFVLLNVFSSGAQELPKSWMPKWKVGDWWRVKTIAEFGVVPQLETRYFKFEIIGNPSIKGEPGFEIKVTPEDAPEFAQSFLVGKKHLNARKIGISDECKKHNTLCGQDFATDKVGAYPTGLSIPFASGSCSLPAFPLTVGRKEFKGEYAKKYPLASYLIQEVHRVSGKELIAKGYKPDGLFNPNQNYYEVSIWEKDPQNNTNKIEVVQIWSPDAPYWVHSIASYIPNIPMWLIDHSWKKK